MWTSTNHRLVSCDATGCSNGIIGREACGKCGGTGNIVIADHPENQRSATFVAWALTLGFAVSLAIIAASAWLLRK